MLACRGALSRRDGRDGARLEGPSSLGLIRRHLLPVNFFFSAGTFFCRGAPGGDSDTGELLAEQAGVAGVNGMVGVALVGT